MKHFALAAVLAATLCIAPRALQADTPPGDHITSVAPAPDCPAPVLAMDFSPTVLSSESHVLAAEFSPTELRSAIHEHAIRPDKPSPTSTAPGYLVQLAEPPLRIRRAIFGGAFRISLIDGHFARPLARPQLS